MKIKKAWNRDAAKKIRIPFYGVEAHNIVPCWYMFHENGKPYKPRQASVAFKRASVSAGIADFRFHDQRHDVATRLARNGYSLYEIQCLLGQKDGRMTQRYAHLQVDDLRRAVHREKSLWGVTKGVTAMRNPLNYLASQRGFEPLLPA